jgi:hypothetical protein
MQCRKHSGHFFVSTDVPRSAVTIEGAEHGPTGTKIAVHVHVADKGDYYEFGDGVPQRD